MVHLGDASREWWKAGMHSSWLMPIQELQILVQDISCIFQHFSDENPYPCFASCEIAANKQCVPFYFHEIDMLFKGFGEFKPKFKYRSVLS